MFKRGRLFTPKVRLPFRNTVGTIAPTGYVRTARLGCPLQRAVCLQIWFTMYYGSLGIIMPYFNVLLAHMGYGARQIGVISILRPLVSGVSGPLLSSTADALSSHHKIFLTALALTSMVRVVPASTHCKHLFHELQHGSTPYAISSSISIKSFAIRSFQRRLISHVWQCPHGTQCCMFPRLRPVHCMLPASPDIFTELQKCILVDSS